MVGATYMIIFLHMTVICGGNGDEKFKKTSASATSQVSPKATTSAKPSVSKTPNNQTVTPQVKIPISTKGLKCCREIMNSNEQGILQNKQALIEYNKCEKESLNSLLNETKTAMIWDLENLNIAVVMINTTELFTHINASDLFNDTQAAQIWIPYELFENLSEEMHKVSVTTYDSINQFTQGLENTTIISNVTRIEVLRNDIVNLTNLLRIQFPVNEITNSSIYSCQSFVEEENIWSTNGCNITNIGDYFVECSCNHMTAFAVLMSEQIEPGKEDQKQWEILSYISYIGCGLSAVFSGCSIFMYILNRNGKREVSRSIHVSLSAALFLLNITFMLSEWAATLNENVCVFVAVAIHYSLLCSFTWMAIEGLHLYILLVRVFNIYIKHYMAKLSLIGWGVPAIFIGCLLTVHSTHPLYGIKNIIFSDANKTNAICWTKDAFIPYAVNMSYFLLIFLFNTGIMVTVSIKIFMLQKAGRKIKTANVYKNASTVLGLMCLLGTTWGLVFFTSGYTNYPILYLFCILNSMQGFFIFLWMCLTERPEKEQMDQKSTLSQDTCTSDIHKQNVMIKT